MGQFLFTCYIADTFAAGCMYRLATVHSITDRQITVCCQ